MELGADLAGMEKRTTKVSYRGPILGLTISIVVLVSALSLTIWRARRDHRVAASSSQRHAAPSRATPWRNARPDVNYVGDSACARCHAEIAETFRRHPMGRSLAPIAALKTDGGDRAGATTTFEAGSSRYTIEHRQGLEIHRETRLDERGQVLAEVEAEVKYALGSGTRGTSYLIEHDGRLFQSPISWFGQKKQFDLAPGYDASNPHFDRAIEPSCLFCHANRVQPIEHSVNRYEQPVFRGHAIGCERCHGPGELHSRRQELVDGRDLTIVNPRHLEPALRMAVCEQCHLLGDHRVDRLGRATFDYRPGLPLTDFFAVYGRAADRGNTAVGQVEQMKFSRCYRESRGRLDCVSCHDPHQVPAPEEKTAYFRRQCLGCHEKAGCKLPASTRLAQSKDDNCVQCHMPRANSIDIVHTATTDHRILRSPRTEATGHPRPAPGPSLVLLNGDHLGADERNALARELAIALALEGPRLADSPEVRQMGSFVLSVLDGVLAKHPDDLLARRMKAQTLALSGRRPEALRLVLEVLRLAPDDEKTLEQCLAYAIDDGNNQAALEPARHAVALDPWSSTFRERLAYVLIQHQDWTEALHQAREALRLDPFRRFARMFVIECLLHNRDRDQADKEFTTLLKLNPSQRESLTQWFAAERQK
jgi:predicted CXXCH cytochrome family protein